MPQDMTQGMAQERVMETALRAPDEPPPVDVIDGDRNGPVLFLCDHASCLIPRSLGNLGLPADALNKHIAWDIGAADVARNLAAAFGAPLVMPGYSRLVIDCNRMLTDPTSIPLASDDLEIPGNFDLSARDAALRAEEFFQPYHATAADLISEMSQDGRTPAVISIHSFTPVYGGFQRPWHVGVLWNRDERLSAPFMAALRREGDLVVGDNEPYSAKENFGYSVDVHAEERGLPHMLVEIRQDLIGTPRGARQWARTVGAAIAEALEAAGCL